MDVENLQQKSKGNPFYYLTAIAIVVCKNIFFYRFTTNINLYLSNTSFFFHTIYVIHIYIHITGVAPARYADEHFGRTNRTALDSLGGVAKYFAKLKDVTYHPSNPPLNYIRVGPKGTNVRTITSCCGTILNTAGGAKFPIKDARPFSRNNIYNADGTLYNLQCGRCADFMLDKAFNDYKHPTGGPAFNGAAFGNAIKAGLKQDTSIFPQHYYKVPDEGTVTVPITWETKSKM